MTNALELSPKIKIPFLSARSPLIGIRDLQKFSSARLDALREEGPFVVCVNSRRRAVLVDYDEYTLLQERFEEIMRLSTNTLRIPVPSGYELKEIKALRLEILATMQKITEEIPESSPLSDFLDTLLNLGRALFGSGENAPAEMKAGAKGILDKTARKVGKKGVVAGRSYSR